MSSFSSPFPELLLLSTMSYSMEYWILHLWDSCPGYVSPSLLPILSLLARGRKGKRRPWHCVSIFQQQPKHWCFLQRFSHKHKAQHHTDCSKVGELHASHAWICVLWADGLWLMRCGLDCLSHRWANDHSLPAVNLLYLQWSQNYCG